MTTWIVRAASLYVFNVVVLVLIGLLLPPVNVGWSVLWAAVVLTLVTLLLKPVLNKAFSNATKGSRGKGSEKAVQYVSVFVVALILWVLTVMFSGVNVRGWFWGYIIPPIVLLIAWVIYDVIDDRVEAKAGELYDGVESQFRGQRAPASEQAAPTVTPEQQAATERARAELRDDLTPEQQKMLDDLG